MIPYVKVESATRYPQMCIACRGGGPFVDTQSELRVPGDPQGLAWMHVYVCVRCAEWIARAAGLLDEQEALRAALTRAEEENVALTELLGRQDAMINEAVQRQKAKRELAAVAGDAR